MKTAALSILAEVEKASVKRDVAALSAWRHRRLIKGVRHLRRWLKDRRDRSRENGTA